MRLRDLPIRRKLVLIVMLASGGALVFATAALVLIELWRSRGEMERDLSSLALILAENTTAALTFDDRAAAQETLNALAARPALAVAALYDERGLLFADFARPGARAPARPGAPGAHFSAGALEVAQPIVLDRQRIGTVYVRSGLEAMYDRLGVQAATVAGVLLGSSLVALALSSGLQRLISHPIRDLAATAGAVSETEDYALRARKQSEDETGQLVDAFNRMLAQIQERDAALSAAKEQLERRVEERTRELKSELAERRKAERRLAAANAELSQSNQELDDFAYIASHDLKEPLRGIHNFSVFLLEDYADRLDDDGRAKLLTLTRLSRRMEDLIDSLLQFSRVGRIDLALDLVDLNETLEGVLESLQVQLAETATEVRIPQPLPSVRCDRVRVGEIFGNLVSNALKYNDKERRWIEIGTLPAPSRPDLDGTSAAVPPAPLPPPPVFYVRDNGIGIPEKHHEAVFRIFKRLHGRDRFGGGTGAGLTIVKKLVERHHGRIWLESQPGIGTTFYFTLAKGA
jgi:signal transduction histidine kinase